MYSASALYFYSTHLRTTTWLQKQDIWSLYTAQCESQYCECLLITHLSSVLTEPSHQTLRSSAHILHLSLNSHYQSQGLRELNIEQADIISYTVTQMHL